MFGVGFLFIIWWVGWLVFGRVCCFPATSLFAHLNIPSQIKHFISFNLADCAFAHEKHIALSPAAYLK